MPYIGNTIRAADDYRLIDDISSGFNGSTTSFALQVAGSAPVPFPKSPQQVLISVNGVIQEPDPTGASGFNLVGTNIVFSSAPTNGHAFFGIIYATADYLNAGGNFPSGSLGAPSITFIGDENSGLYRKSGGSVGFVSDATEIANFDSNGITISSGNIIIPDSIIHNGDGNTKIRFPATDTISFETSGTEKFRVDGSGHISIGTATSRAIGGAIERKLQIEATDASAGITITRNGNASTPPFLGFGKQRSGAVGGNTVVQNNDQLGQIYFAGGDGTDIVSVATSIASFVDGTPGSNDMPGRLVFSTTADGAASPTERMRIDSSGKVGIGETNPEANLHVKEGGSGVSPDANRDTLFIENNGNSGITIGTPNSNSAYVAFADPEDDNAGQIIYRHASNSMSFFTAGSEVIRIDSSGRLMIGTTTEGHSNADDLTVNNSANCGITIRSGSSNDGNIFFSDDTSGNGETKGVIKYKHADDALVFNSNGNERMRLDSSGRLLIGTNSTRSVAGNSAKSQIESTDSQCISITSTSANSTGPQLALGKTRNGSTVQDDDSLGKISFAGDDGSDLNEIGAKIEALCDAATAANRVPARLEFYTENAASTMNLNMVITRDSQVFFPSGDSRDNMASYCHSTADDFAFGKPSATADTGMTIVGNPSFSSFINFSDGSSGQRQGAIVYQHGNGSDNMFLRTNGNQNALTIDSSQRILIGTTTGTGHSLTGSNNPKLQVESASTNDYGRASFIFNGNTAVGPGLWFGKSRGTSVGSNTIVNDGDQCGGFFFHAADGTDKFSRIASIEAKVDGTPGSNDTPGRLVFGTTADGSDSVSERMRIDSSGDVTIYKKILLGASGPASRIDPSSAGELYIDADPGSNYGNSTIRFRIDGLEMARIVAGTHKNFLIGRTTTQASERLSVQNSSNQDVAFLTQSQTAQNTRNVVLLNSYAQTDFANQIVFMDHQGGIRGTIKNNTSSTQYNTSSDYRLKENEVEISDGIDRLKQLKPYRFNWKNRPNTTVDGFFAHEVQDLVEDCVSGTKDGVDSNGDPEYQEMDHSKLVPLLTAALKESITKIETLETKVAALEAA